MIGDCVPISNFLKIPIYSYNINIVAPSSDCKADEWTFDGLDIFMMSVWYMGFVEINFNFKKQSRSRIL
jgi:hypothetical protein